MAKKTSVMEPVVLASIGTAEPALCRDIDRAGAESVRCWGWYAIHADGRQFAGVQGQWHSRPLGSPFATEQDAQAFLRREHELSMIPPDAKPPAIREVSITAPLSIGDGGALLSRVEIRPGRYSRTLCNLQLALIQQRETFGGIPVKTQQDAVCWLLSKLSE